MDPVSVGLVSAATVAAGAYLNAKLAIGVDLKNIRHERKWGEGLQRRMQEFGEDCSMFAMFEKVKPELEALWFEGRSWTYGEVKNDVHRLAAFLEEKGLRKRETVAVFTTNSPEMVIAVLALSKLGVVAGLINTSLRDDTLKHCITVATAQTVISTPDLAQFIPNDLRNYTIDLGSFKGTSRPEGPEIVHLTSENLPIPTYISPHVKLELSDVVVLIFTSGTTGKPKACALRNQMMLVTSTPTPSDERDPKKYYPLRTYSPLPLFHGTAFFTGVCYSIGTSGTLCIGRKFSSSRFWKEVTESRATRILYVGELCRYLVNSPPSPYDLAHNCIVAAGNGLRGEIWEKFKARFGVPEIREFYRSTEGLAKFDNWGGGAWGAGKVGFRGPLARMLDNDTQIIKVDPETEVPYRDPETGFCVKTEIGEAGECIGRVKSRATLTEYLNNPGATNGKLLFDVFVKGDCWQRMGDMLVHDPDGWIRFHDRMGDTFRWKGENVSAGEVRDHIAKLDGVLDAVVYGVKLPSYDGQAGAAALTLDSEADQLFMSRFYSGLRKTGLPAYAMPRLVRITKEIEENATFKKSKGDLIKKSWMAGQNGNTDKLYWLDGTKYKQLDASSWGEIETGRAKL